MTKPLIISLSSNTTRPSRALALASRLSESVASRIPVEIRGIDIAGILPSLGVTTDPRHAPDDLGDVLATIARADALIVASAVYKGSYTGLFKHLIDLIDPKLLAGKPVLLAATGGSDRHALVIEHQMRPLFSFFNAVTVPTGVYAVDGDFADGLPANADLVARIDRAAGELVRLLAPQTTTRLALSA
jgi:FMN reductase